ncbi:MAG: sigma-54-dependent Fis family transcriptional regulator [Calditrichaeota bacterium]|nr:sigma-54-dependent Fis family transcriptional regulator [Calditrichota bacterium]
MARAIYQSSRRKATSFIKVNCAAIPAELLESELFGHRKGAFTGAVSDRTGRFQAAHRGTLFLDEIGDMALGLQAKLLRVLENEEIEIVGENISRPVDVRIIAATNRELETLIQQRHFREDLYYRLKVVTLRVPALRERPEDILPLAYHFLKVYREENNRKIQRIERAGEMMLVNYPWPGNVRELRNLLEGLVIFSDEPVISAREVREALLAGTEAPPPGEQNKMIPLTEALNQFERDFLIRALTQCDWRIAETARLLDIDRASLFRKMKKFGIKRPPSH